MADGYNRENLTAFVERSLVNLNTDSLDLVQLHCPPTDVYYRPEVFGVLDDLQRAGKIRHYGVSVERVEEALKALARSLPQEEGSARGKNRQTRRRRRSPKGSEGLE